MGNFTQHRKFKNWGHLVAYVAVFFCAGCLSSSLAKHKNASNTRSGGPVNSPSAGQSISTSENSTPSTDAPESTDCPIKFSNEELCASISWNLHPADNATGEFLIRFWDLKTGTENGPFVDPKHVVKSRVWMPDMGQGSSPVKVEKHKDVGGQPVAGTFRATNVYFSKPGTWEVWVQLMTDGPDQTVFEQGKEIYEY